MFQRDQWLSDLLKMPCYGMNGVDSNMSSVAVLTDMITTATKGPAFFVVKQASQDVAGVETLVRAGFNIADVSVTFMHDGKSPEPNVSGEVVLEPATASDEADVVDIAGRCFVHSRFHADRRIGTARADTIKREWARNACRGRAEVVYVARREGAVAGFLAVMKLGEGVASKAVIDLIGVDEKYQGQGIGRSLSQYFIREWHGKVDRLVVGTQVANVPALRLYESLGFRMSNTSYVLHAHIEDGALAA